MRHDVPRTGASCKHVSVLEGAPVSLLNLRTAYLSWVMLPREGGMVPKIALLVMSKFCRLLALPMVEGMVPVSWLLYSVSTCSLDDAGSTLGMEPVRLLLPAAQHVRQTLPCVIYELARQH